MTGTTFRQMLERRIQNMATIDLVELAFTFLGSGKLTKHRNMKIDVNIEKIDNENDENCFLKLSSFF